jgi:chromosome segregation ATPase
MRDPATLDRTSTDGLEEVLTGDAEYFDATPEDAIVEPDDYAAQSTRETLDWLRERLDERDAKIEQLNKELQSANYRNGYLESQVQHANDQVKLLTDREREQAKAEPSWWSKFASWFMGKKN